MLLFIFGLSLYHVYWYMCTEPLLLCSGFVHHMLSFLVTCPLCSLHIVAVIHHQCTLLPASSTAPSQNHIHCVCVHVCSGWVGVDYFGGACWSEETIQKQAMRRNSCFTYSSDDFSKNNAWTVSAVNRTELKNKWGVDYVVVDRSLPDCRNDTPWCAITHTNIFVLGAEIEIWSTLVK